MALYSNNSHGFSLLELLLVITITSVVFTGAARVFSDWFDESIDRKASREIVLLKDVSQEYVLTNFELLIDNDIPNVGDIVEIPVSDLIDEGFLPAAYNPQNAYRQTLRVFVRHVDDSSVKGNVIEVLALSDDTGGRAKRIPDKRLFRAAENGGPSVGFVSNLTINATCCDGTIQSLQGGWSLDLSDFSSVYSAIPDTTGGYLAAYGRVTLTSTVTNNILHRVAVEGASELNRMETNLNLDGHDIINAGVIVSDSVDIVGNANFNMDSPKTGGDPSYVLLVQDSFGISQDLVVNANGNDAKGDVVILGNGGFGADFIVNGTANILSNNGTSNGDISADLLFANSLNVDGEARFDRLDNGGETLSAGNIYSDTTSFAGVVETDEFQGSSLENLSSLQSSALVSAITNVSNGRVNASGSMQVDNNISFRNQSVNLLSGQNVTVTNEMFVRRLGVCGDGCP